MRNKLQQGSDGSKDINWEALLVQMRNDGILYQGSTVKTERRGEIQDMF